jgi:hypothetical protein
MKLTQVTQTVLISSGGSEIELLPLTMYKNTTALISDAQPLLAAQELQL